KRGQQRRTDPAFCKTERLLAARAWGERFARCIARLRRRQTAETGSGTGRCHRRLLLQGAERGLHTCSVYTKEVRTEAEGSGCRRRGYRTGGSDYGEAW